MLKDLVSSCRSLVSLVFSENGSANQEVREIKDDKVTKSVVHKEHFLKFGRKEVSISPITPNFTLLGAAQSSGTEIAKKMIP